MADPRQIREVLAQLRAAGYEHLMSVHGVDYYPEEPRLGVIYELLDRVKLDRVRVKLRVSTWTTAQRRVRHRRTGRRPTTRSARSTTCSASSSTATRTCAAS